MAGQESFDADVVGVFRDQQAALAAARAVEQAGVDPRQIRVGRERDEVVSLRGEMREEMEHTLVGPGSVGPYTKEMTKGMSVVMPLAILVGALVVLPFGFIPMGGLSLGARLAIAAVVGAVAGASLAFVIGPLRGQQGKGPARPLAAEHGVTVAVHALSPSEARKAADALEHAQPIRIDVVTPEGQPTGTVTTEEEHPAG